MKTKATQSTPAPIRNRRGKKRGIALITVLMVLSLMMILVMAILSTSMNATSSADRNANSIRVKDLANTVSSLAIAQIRAATTARPVTDGETIPPFTWSSQPGMIRTYSTEGMMRAYPLYSSSKGEFQSMLEIASESQRFASWNLSPERFVDLNAPSVSYDNNGRESDRVFPILDPRASLIDKIEGFTFDITNAPGSGIGGDVGSGDALPMPVEWLYMLKNGALGTLNATGNFVGSDNPTEANPIVARIAYWVDDESTKININTASEGAYWDVPRVATESARDFGLYQPGLNEASRFPGHPATTCLSSVFFPDHYINPILEDEKKLTDAHLEQIYELAPKIDWGGTKGGTQSANAATEVIDFDQDRLYASIDEMVFRMASRGGTRLRNRMFQGDVTGISPERIERARGLLTAHSRAPELNVFGRPRMALWPLHQNEGGRANQFRSAFDNAIAFASTLGSRTSRRPSDRNKFFLQRNNSQSRTWEFYRHGDGNNKRLYQYVMDQTHQPIPGYGKSLAEKYGASDAERFDYRRASRATRDLDLERDCFRDHAKIGAMIFDYLRGTNLYDANVTDPYADLDPDGDNFTPFGQTTPFILHDTDLLNGNGGNDDTTWPDFKPKPKGIGRLFTVSEVALVIFCSADGRLVQAGTPGDGEFPYENPRVAPRFTGIRGNGNANQGDERALRRHPMAFNAALNGKYLRYLQVGVVFELFAPMQGFHMIHPLTTVRMVTGGDGYKGAFGKYDGEDALPNKDNIPPTQTSIREGYKEHTGYKLISRSGFHNPLTYWGAQQGTVGETGSNPTGPVLQTIPKNETNLNAIKRELPSSWYGVGGYGGYRILRFADINIRPGREVHQSAGRELTNGNNTLGGIYTQKGIVVDADSTRNRGSNVTMRFQAPKDSAGNLVPMQFLIYDADSGSLSNGNVIQTFEIAFPDGVFPVPELAHSSNWEGWGRRFGRAGRDQAMDGRVDVITRNDVVRSMIPVHGDYRHIAAKRFVPQTLWAPHPFYSDAEEIKAHSLSWSNPSGAEEVTSRSFRSQLGALGATFLDDINAKRGGDTRGLINDKRVNDKYSQARNRARRYRADITYDPEDEEIFAPGIDHENNYIVFDPDLTRDFDNGVGSARDGAYTNKADDGADVSRQVRYPYFEVTPANRFDYRDAVTEDNTYSPNQAIPSPVTFGSLPSLVDANIPWNTLLFRPNLLPEDGKHPETGEKVLRFGAAGVGVEIDYEITDVRMIDNPATRRNEARDRHQGIVNTRTRSVEDEQLPPEHFWLDLFWMPTVQPYPLSEPFSTAGKINLNYEMMPFTYIDRATALHALFKSERMLAIPTDQADTYKDGSDDEDRQVKFFDDSADPWYKRIDAVETLKQFKAKFERGEAFMAESEICEMFLYPKTKEDPVTYDEEGKNIRRFWDDHKLTGDNSMERPYANIYPRITTKSNVFTVHMTVEVLKKSRRSSPGTWNEDQGDRVVAAYRGSSTIERYIDPNRSLGRVAGAMPKYIDERNPRASTQEGLEEFYEYRVVNQKQFAR